METGFKWQFETIFRNGLFAGRDIVKLRLPPQARSGPEDGKKTS